MSTESVELELVGGDALMQITKAEIDQQIATAKRYPRDFSVVKRNMLSLATLDEETAATCFYKLSRQGKNIEGPSVRMAEIAISCFQNMRAGARVISNDGKTITAQGFCHDLENNVSIAVEIKRRITNKEGVTFSEDMQVVTGNAACAIAFRNAAFKVVPMALIKPVTEAAKKTAVGDIKTLADRRTGALKYFASIGVNEKRVLHVLGKTAVDSIGITELETLIGLTTAIKDGNTSVDEAFPEIIERANIQNVEVKMEAKPKTDTIPTRSKLATMKPKEEPAKTEPTPEPEQEPEADNASTPVEPEPVKEPTPEAAKPEAKPEPKKEAQKKATGNDASPLGLLKAFIEENSFTEEATLKALRKFFPRQADEMKSIDSIPEKCILLALDEKEELSEGIKNES